MFLINNLWPRLDSAPHAAPSLLRKCNELKRARLADDLNDKLAKRPGPLELVESGILVSSDSTLTDAIKDGKISYPRTSTYIQQLEQQVNYDQNLFNLDDPSLNYLNFNFNNLTDNEDSNASQSSTSTTKTTNTLASLSSSATSFNLTGLNGFQQSQTSPQPALLQQGELNSYNDFFHVSNVPSPTSLAAMNTFVKSSPSSSPYHATSFEFNQQTSSTDNKQTAIIKSSGNMKQFKQKTFSSASSVSSNTSGSSKTNRPSRNNSNTSQTSLSNGPNSNGSASTKKLSQLIFHEYRGPHQKSSKSSISLKTNVAKSTNTKNSFSFKSNLGFSNGSGSSSSNNNSGSNQTNTSEIFFDDSNDSTNNNLNSAIMDMDSVSEALNPHKIRIKQQKIFLKYTNSSSSNKALEDSAKNKAPTTSIEIEKTDNGILK